MLNLNLSAEDIKRIDQDGLKSVIQSLEMVVKHSRCKSTVEEAKAEIQYLRTFLDD